MLKSLLARLRGAPKAVETRLVDDWRHAHKWWSTRATLAAGLLPPLLKLFDFMPGVWNQMPVEVKALMPNGAQIMTGLFMAAMIIGARLWKQGGKSDGQVE